MECISYFDMIKVLVMIDDGSTTNKGSRMKVGNTKIVNFYYVLKVFRNTFDL